MTIQQLLDIGILNDSNYEYTYAAEYDRVMDYVYKHEAGELNKRLIVLIATYNSGKFMLNIKPDDYLIRRYEQVQNYDMMEAVTKVSEMCKKISDCKKCQYYRELKPNGSLFDNCLLAGSIPSEW